jgi:hypothetical protein
LRRYNVATTFDGTFDSTFRGATVSSITLSAGTRTLIQAYATKDDYRDSATAAKTITVYSGTVATPVISQTSGQNKFTIACETAEAVIRYTTDGTTPSRTVGSTYSGEVTAEYGDTIKAFAYKDYWLDSDVASLEIEVLEIFEPPIANVIAWFDITADTITTDESGNITAWADRAGSDFAFVKNGTKNTPAWDSVNAEVTFDKANSESLICTGGLLTDVTNLTLVVIKKLVGDVPQTETIMSTRNASSQELKLMTVTGSSAAYMLAGLHCGTGLNNTGYVTQAAMQAAYKLIMSNYIPAGTSSIYAYNCPTRSGSGNAGSYAMDGSNVVMGAYYTGNEQFVDSKIKAVILVNGTIATDSQAFTDLKAFCKTNYGADT